MTVASASPWMANHPSLKEAWLGHVNHLNFGGHRPYLWNGRSSQVLSTSLDGQCCKLVTVSVASLSHWPSTSVYNTVGPRFCMARVCQRQRRPVPLSFHGCRPALTADISADTVSGGPWVADSLNRLFVALFSRVSWRELCNRVRIPRSWRRCRRNIVFLIINTKEARRYGTSLLTKGGRAADHEALVCYVAFGGGAIT